MNRERASVLMLMPAVLLIVFVLGVIVIDAGAAYLARRQLTDFATSAADGAAATAFDRGSFYSHRGALRVDEHLAEIAVQRAVRADRQTGGLEITGADVTVSADASSVTVSARGRFRDAFGPHSWRIVRATATASLHQVRTRP